MFAPLFDFSQPFTGGSIPHLNQKGVQTWDRKTKDVYYLYKANWNPEPMVYVASRDWKYRTGAGSKSQINKDKDRDYQTIDIYSNLDKVELLCNGMSDGFQKPNSIKKISWNVKLNPGKNIIEARSIKDEVLYQDMIIIEYSDLLENANDLFRIDKELAVNVGFNATFIDESGMIWYPDQSYYSGSFGYINGKSNMIEKDLIVQNSGTNTPIFNYYQSDIESYRVDIADGDYEVELFFCEPEDLNVNDRVFNILINNQLVLEKLDLIKECGFLGVLSRCFVITVSDGSGLEIVFEEIKGESILNALRVKKL